MKLDLGCGPDCREGYEGVDRVAQPGVLHVVNLDPWMAPPLYYWPFDDSSVDALHSSNLVEHIRDLVGFMSEAWRVLKPDGEFTIHHPYQFNVRAWQDPTHVRCLNEVSFFYFDSEWRNKLHPNDVTDTFGATDFEVVECDAIAAPEWEHVARDNPEDFERAAHNQINVIADLRWTLRCRKG